jgi:hypothetical protein
MVKIVLNEKVAKKVKMDHNGVAGKLREDYGIWVGTGFNNDHIRLVTHRNVTKEHC